MDTMLSIVVTYNVGKGAHLSHEGCNLPGFSSCVHNITLNPTHPSFIHPSIHSRIHSSSHSCFKQLCVPGGGRPPISGGFNIFNEHTSGYKWRVYITGLWPTAAGTIPLLSPVIWLSPSLLATEGKGYYSFVAFESSVLSELPSVSSSSQITAWGIFMTTSQFSPEKVKRRKQVTHHRMHSNG